MKAKNKEKKRSKQEKDDNEFTWDADMQKAWDDWTWEGEQENKWDEYARLSSQEAVPGISKHDMLAEAAKSSRVNKGQQEAEHEEAKGSKKKRKDVPQEEEPRETPPKKKNNNPQKDSPALPASPQDRPPFPYTTKEQIPSMVALVQTCIIWTSRT